MLLINVYVVSINRVVSDYSTTDEGYDYAEKVETVNTQKAF